jgi:hypothetical protein
MASNSQITKVTAVIKEDFEIKEFIRKAYREYYLRPKKMVSLLRTLSISDLLGLSLYALRTKNI